MNIVFFTNEYAHPKLPSSGGVGSFLKTMAEAMTQHGHKVHIYGFGKREIRFEDEGIRFEFFKNYKKQFPISEFKRSIGGKLNIKNSELNFLKKERQYLAEQLKTYCKSHHIDIIESFVFNGFTAYWDHTVPLVIRFHGSRGFWYHYLGAKEEPHKIYMEQLALQNTPHTIAVSEFSAQAVKEIYNIAVDKVIYNGIDTTLFSPQPEVSEIEQSIFYFGTLSKAKGVDVLAQVFNQVVENYPKASLHLIGRGQEFLNHISQTILSPKALKNMTYYGTKQMHELPELLSQASVCVFPSLNETFGLIIAESMALQKPVIASNIPSFNEIITHSENGFIAKQASDYLDYINLIFNNSEEKKRIATNARQHVINLFSKAQMVQQSVDYYQEILSKNDI